MKKDQPPRHGKKRPPSDKLMMCLRERHFECTSLLVNPSPGWKMLGISPSTWSANLDRLEDHGFLDHAKNLTATGKVALDAWLKAREPMVQP